MKQIGGISLEGISKIFGNTTAIDNVSLDIPDSSFTVLLGPSGCGKSTLLRLIAGLETPTSGHIRIDDCSVEDKPASARNLSMVFQSYALFPHLTVADNILFGLQVRKVCREDQRAQLARVADMMGLDRLLDRKPSQLSGGQQQRVALARAVISGRRICLMDEPLSNLDAKLRQEMRQEIRDLQQKLGLTMVYVTHDQVEAITMADQVVLLNEGRIDQVATPAQMYDRPETVFSARFIGTPAMNLIPAEKLTANSRLQLPENTVFGIRPEDVRLDTGGPVPAVVTGVEYLGADQLVTCRIGDQPMIARLPARDELPDDGNVTLAWKPRSQHLFDAQSGQRLDFPYPT